MTELEKNKRRFPRYLLSSQSEHFRGSVDIERITNDTIYTFGRGGAGFLSSEKDDTLFDRNVLTTVFLFEQFSDDLFAMPSRLVYISEQKLTKKNYYIYGVQFLDVNDFRLLRALDYLDSLYQRGRITTQHEI